MANLKNITDVPVVESAEGLNLIVNDNGAAKQIAASAVGAQADWAETDASNPAFIKNKPVEEWDLCVEINSTMDMESGETTYAANVTSGTFNAVKSKILENGQTKIKARLSIISPMDETLVIYESGMIFNAVYVPENFMESSPEIIGFLYFSTARPDPFRVILFPDNTIEINM